jgi:hydrogenase maturation protease
MLLVIGYGNPLRCDDRLGQYLAETLDERWIKAMFITSTQLTPELAEPISRAERVVFVSANAGETPGAVSCKAVEAGTETGEFTYNVTPASLLVAARELCGTAPRAIIVSITGASFGYGCAFSAEIDALLPQITNTVGALIQGFFASHDDERVEKVSSLVEAHQRSQRPMSSPPQSPVSQGTSEADEVHR